MEWGVNQLNGPPYRYNLTMPYKLLEPSISYPVKSYFPASLVAFCAYLLHIPSRASIRLGGYQLLAARQPMCALPYA